MGSLVHNYNEYLQGDPVIDTWAFMQSPVPMIAILVAYLYFVLKLGPNIMANKQPFTLKWVLIVYNFYQVVFSTWLCFQMFFTKDSLQMFYQACKTASINRDLHEDMARDVWWYFFSKIIELLDTVFFVLRKKQSQVTFLHVYHHASTMFFSWVYLKYLPGPQVITIGFLNSFVHIVMYTYYLIAALGPKYHKYLWWKKYMTWLQLAQFCIMLTYLLLLVVMGCKFPKALTFICSTKVIIFMYLFSDFYRKAYRKSKNLTNTSMTVEDIKSK